MIKAILKSIALVIGCFILQAIANFILYFIGIDPENTSLLFKMGLVESAVWLLVIGTCIHWIIEGFKKLIGKA